MKRPRNVDCGKMRRPLKRNKITDGIYGSTFLYLRFLLVWALVLMADFILEFRFEYLWPFWLLVRSVYDSFKYQGLTFSVFFVCIAVTSDVICYLFIPVQWLFFAASTYVWVQYVWHTDRGICLPTVSLWLLFVYIEASIRLRELKSLPFNLDLCRPFACHCIGYPVVTLGFGFKSYVSYRMRLRRQKVIQKENDFYLQILQQALPAEVQYADKPKALPSKSEEELIPNGSSHNKKVSWSKLGDDREITPANNMKSKSSKNADFNEDDELEYIEKSIPRKASNVNQFDEHADNLANEQQAGKAFKSGNSSVAAAVAVAAASTIPVSSNKTNNKQLNSTKDSLGGGNSSSNSSAYPPSSSKKGKNMYKEIQPSPSPSSFTNNKEEVILRLETDVKKLKADLQASRNCEHELRSQISSSSSEDKAMRSELYQLQQDNENLQNKLHNLVTSRQQDKLNLVAIEKKLAEERKARALLEQQLVSEKKSKSAEAAAAARAMALATASRNECSESCKARRRDFDNDVKHLRRENKLREEHCRQLEDVRRQLEQEVKCLRQFKDTQKKTDEDVKSLKDKNLELENSLCAETRFKQDLFSALNKERNEIRILQNAVMEKDKDINEKSNEVQELKSKIAEVMALIPSPAVTSYQHPTNERNSSPLFSSSFNNGPSMNSNLPSVFNGTDLASSSELNPNASDYKPKSAI